jgi:hypothetical protein
MFNSFFNHLCAQTPNLFIRNSHWLIAKASTLPGAMESEYSDEQSLALFNARTTERRILTTGHRIYGGKGPHLHAGWDLNGEYVEFTSTKYGNADVCLVAVPKEWSQ